jgi:LmbE family N-acetylglucosaminyl deacetylase
MTIITPHADDEALFMGEIVGHADKIILLTDSGGSEPFRSNHPHYGADRRKFFKSLYRHAEILELNSRDGEGSHDLTLWERAADFVNFPLVSVNPDGHIDHEKAWMLARSVCRHHQKPLMVAFAYDDGLKLYRQPPYGTPYTKFHTAESGAEKNRLIDAWQEWFAAHYPTRNNPFFQQQRNQSDVVSILDEEAI